MRTIRLLLIPFLLLSCKDESKPLRQAIAPTYSYEVQYFYLVSGIINEDSLPEAKIKPIAHPSEKDLRELFYQLPTFDKQRMRIEIDSNMTKLIVLGKSPKLSEEIDTINKSIPQINQKLREEYTRKMIMRKERREADLILCRVQLEKAEELVVSIKMERGVGDFPELKEAIKQKETITQRYYTLLRDKEEDAIQAYLYPNIKPIDFVSRNVKTLSQQSKEWLQEKGYK